MSSTSIAPTVRRRVPGPSAIVPGAPDCCRRAATFTASPVDEGRVDVLDDELARLDARCGLEAELAHRVEHRERGAHRALGVVLVRLRHAEGGHHGVAGELLDRAAVLLDAGRRALEVRGDAPPDDLGIARRRRSARRIDEIDEEHGCELAFHLLSVESRSRVRGSGRSSPRTARSTRFRLSLRAST